ncbi:MAG: TonB-dependent receptor [Bacteroidaceae bacterium]|nr:TonB-dependent receptor [Bacteroidaceae bacterium]
MMKKLTMILACLFLSVGMAFAQSTVSGTVTSKSDGQPVIGATVKVVGINVGAVTDANGRFTFTAPKGAKHVEVSYVGMITQTIPVGSNLRIVLAEDPKVLDEVMVVAYGTTKKSSFTGSAETVDSKEMELRPITSATKAIEGHVNGVQTTSGSGQPGSSPSIIIRGFGSINASNTPLYVVDGIPYDGSIASINPSDIESMTVLKDASAGALYGARGANGVVMITTKKGKEGKPEVTWRSTVGWNSRSLKPYDNVDMKEFVQLLYEAYRNDNIYRDGMDWESGEAAARAALSGKLGGELYNPFKNYTWNNIIDPATGQVRPDAQAAWDENWMDEIQRKNAFRHEHQFQIAGGSERTKYMMSLGYLNEDGTLKTTNFQRYSARVNVQSEVTDWFSANMNTSLGHSIQNYSRFTGTANSNVWYTAQFANPLFPVYIKNLDGTNALDANGNPQLDYGENGRPGTLSDFSVLGGLYDDISDVRSDIASVRTGLVFGSDSDRFGWAKGIKLALNFGLDYNNSNEMEYYNMYHGNQANAGGLIYKYNGRTQSYTFNQLLTWNRSFGKHNIDFLVGHEWYDYKYNYLSGGKSNLVDGIYELRPGTTLQDADSYSDNYRIDSWLSRLNYNFADKYYFSASLRSDKSSRFHKDNNKGTFWSLGANWRITGEEFMKSVKWVDNLSFKVSYGEQGNDNLGSYYAWQSLYNLSYSNGDNVGGVITSLETKDLTWEKNGNFNIGIEGALFDRRVRFNFEYYYRKTTDMLLSYPMALSTGFSGYNANVGDMRNTGVEMELTVTPIKTKDLVWDFTFMGNTVSNKVLKLTQESPEIVSSPFIIKEGMPYNTFYLPKSAGVDPTNGQQLYWAYKKDDDGNKIDGSEYITKNTAEATNSRYYQGSRIPDFYGSIGTNLSWKGIDLSVLTTYSLGGKIYDALYYGSMNVMYINDTWNRSALRRWQQPGDVTDVPRMSFNSTNIVTDRYLIDASYFAIKNITLGYTFPTSLVTSWGLGGLKVFASADNLVQFNHLDGMNPQYNFSGSTSYTYAPNKTISLGIEVKF